MKLGKSIRLCLFVFACLLINCFGKLCGEMFSLPVWLDAIGTVFAAYGLGPFCGAIIGGATNIIYGIHSPTAYYYIFTNISVGIIVGFCKKKGFLKDLFGIMSTAFVVTMASVILSLPLNYIISDGAIGNVWGDGMAALLMKMGFNDVVCHIVGQFYMDFLDKTLTMLLLFIAIKLIEKKNNYEKSKSSEKKTKSIISGMLAIIFALYAFPVCDTVCAESADNSSVYEFEKYMRIVYNGENGLPGGMANDIVQTKDGVLWIGTYGGLYRYCGNNIEWMNNLESVKTVNCLYTDEAGRLWIGTNDNGLSIFINDRISNVLNKYDGFPSNSVRCITESSNGFYYAGTTDSLVVLTLSGGLKVYDVIPEIVYAKSISSDNAGNVAAVTDNGVLFVVNGTEIVTELAADGIGNAYSCCAFDKNGRLYVGTSGNTVETFDISEGRLNKLGSVKCGELSGLNSLTFSEDDALFISADNGAGCILPSDEYRPIEVKGFNNSLQHMIIDYQGNLWFTSSRLGLLCLCQSVFSEIGQYYGLSGNVVNSVIKWNDILYVGTDNGLESVITNKQRFKDTLTEALKGVRVRCLAADSENNLWVCTSGKGIWKVYPNKKIVKFDSSTGTSGDKFRSVIESEDGTFIAVGDYGITFIKDDNVIKTISSADGLTNPKILAICEKPDGSLLAGTDGNGIAVIKDGVIVDNIKQEDGLSSDIILRIVQNFDDNGYFVVTANGLCYMDESGSIRILGNFPYYNNYDVIEGKNGELFVLSSAGIFVVNKDELLDGGNLKYLLLDSKRGLNISLTPNSWNYIDEDSNLYVCGDTGVASFNMLNYDISMRSYRMKLKEIIVDGEAFLIENGKETVIPSGASELVITPEIVNYSTNNPEISLYMEGIDSEPKIVFQNELTSLVYNNIPSGSFTFHLAILDSRTDNVISENTYKIVKEIEIYEHWWFRFYAVIVAVITVAYLTWLIFRTQIGKTLRLQKMELELVKNQIKMGNDTILTIAKAVDAKDENTSQHSVRVSEYSIMIAKRLGYNEEQCENLRKIAILHDIGKIGIPDSVLNKPAKLTDEEYAIMKSHVIRGAEILKNFTMIENVADGALYHHERYDGSGYVNGLKGEEIPLNARIIGIADAFDAMTANRVYRKKLDLDFVISELKRCRGTQFDPKLVDIMLELIEDGTIDVFQIYGKKLNEVYSDEK